MPARRAGRALIEARRVEKGGIEPAMRRIADDAETLLPEPVDHGLEQRLLGSNGVARRLNPVEQFVMQPRAVRIAAVGKAGSNRIQPGETGILRDRQRRVRSVV